MRPCALHKRSWCCHHSDRATGSLAGARGQAMMAFSVPASMGAQPTAGTCSPQAAWPCHCPRQALVACPRASSNRRRRAAVHASSPQQVGAWVLIVRQTDANWVCLVGLARLARQPSSWATLDPCCAPLTPAYAVPRALCVGTPRHRTGPPAPVCAFGPAARHKRHRHQQQHPANNSATAATVRSQQ